MTTIIAALFLGFLILGPTKLAEFASKAGSWYASLQKAKSELLADVALETSPPKNKAGSADEALAEAGAVPANADSIGIAASIEQLCEDEYAAEPQAATGPEQITASR